MTKLIIKQYSKSSGKLLAKDEYEFQDTETALKVLSKSDSRMIKSSIRFNYIIKESQD